MSEISTRDSSATRRPLETAGYFTIPGISDARFTDNDRRRIRRRAILFSICSARPVRPQTWVEGLSINAGDCCSYNGIFGYAIEHWSDRPTHANAYERFQRAME